MLTISFRKSKNHITTLRIHSLSNGRDTLRGFHQFFFSVVDKRDCDFCVVCPVVAFDLNMPKCVSTTICNKNECCKKRREKNEPKSNVPT